MSSLVNPAPARHLSLDPSPGPGPGPAKDTAWRESRPSTLRRPTRESTLESAGQAADIFDLYGLDNGDGESDGDGAEERRHSWQSNQGNGMDQPDLAVRTEMMELLDSPTSPEAWDGPVAALQSNRRSAHCDPIDMDTPVRRSGSNNAHGGSGGSGGTPSNSHERERWSSIANGTPDISVTDTSPGGPGHALHDSRGSSGLPVLGTNVSPPAPRRSSSLFQSQYQNQNLPRSSEHDPTTHSKHVTLASTTSNNTTPAGSPSKSHPHPHPHPDVARLSPRHANKARFSRTSQASQATDTSLTMSFAPSSSNSALDDGSTSMSRNGSQASIAGSAQYPGEENDAYYVRSTYARLDTEGVHGDGWDPGVERTRGGPASKRATVFPANRAGNLGEQEREYLANLDRYGFVHEPHRNRSESRIALIPTAPLLRIPKFPSASPLAGQAPQAPNTSLSPSDAGPSPKIPSSPRAGEGEEDKRRKKEEERVGKWAKMMSVKGRDEGGNIARWEWRRDGQGIKLPRRVYKGIPDRWRMAAWWTLAEDRAGHSLKGKGKTSEDIGQIYRNTIDLPSTFDVQIDLDVPRTISGHTMFVTRYGAGQRNLWHVLHCFSQVCETCGYVQGMGPIAATLLCYFDPERAYALLVRLHDLYGMHDIFAPGFPGLLEAFYVQERLMEWLMPEVYKSFQRNMISSTSWGTKWYITLFVNTVPFSQQLRLWDALWLDGRDVMIMTSVALLWAFKDLLAAPTATFESILSLLSSYFVAEDEDALLHWIRKMLNLPGIRARMDGWRGEWQVLVKEGKSATALL